MPGDRPPLLVWRRGEALLAVEVDAVLEIVKASTGGTVDSREGNATVVDLPGLPRGAAGHAIVVRAGEHLLALPADVVEGVRAVGDAAFATTPAWLGTLAPGQVRALITLDDDRLAALLALDAIRPAS